MLHKAQDFPLLAFASDAVTLSIPCKARVMPRRLSALNRVRAGRPSRFFFFLFLAAVLRYESV